MATVGNSASLQLMMAMAKTNYDRTGLAYPTLKGSKYMTGTAARDNLNNLLDGALKNKSDLYKEQFSSLYKSIYGLTDETEEKADSAASLKVAANKAQTSAERMTRFAKGLKYGGEVDTEEYADTAKKFIDSYNSMIDKTADSDSQSVLQKGVLMVNTAKVYGSSLRRAGIELGSDNKLTLNDDLSGVTATDIKTTFGQYGFAGKVAQKAEQISRLSGSMGAFSYNNYSVPNYAYSIGALFSTYA